MWSGEGWGLDESAELVVDVEVEVVVTVEEIVEERGGEGTVGGVRLVDEVGADVRFGKTIGEEKWEVLGLAPCEVWCV